ncbi:MAG: hypothetical protein Q8Q65_00520 [bacterium]|nr:hypothetical protein [bacterium]
MSDPRRIKKLGKIAVDLKYNDMSQSVKFHTFVDAEILKNIPKEVIIAGLKPEINKVSLKRGTEFYRTLVSYSYSEGYLKEFNYGNTLVEVNLPYCLHFPNHSEFKVKIKEKKTRSFSYFSQDLD